MLDINEELGVIHHFPTVGNNVYIRQMSAKEGYIIGSHKHKYEHYSILTKGSALAEVDGNVEELNAPSVILVPANKEHKITALSDITWFCIHGTEEKNIENIDEVLINKELTNE